MVVNTKGAIFISKHVCVHFISGLNFELFAVCGPCNQNRPETKKTTPGAGFSNTTTNTLANEILALSCPAVANGDVVYF